MAETGVSAGPVESGLVAGLPGSCGLPILARNPLTGILSPKRTTATRPVSEGLRVPCGQVSADRVSYRDGYRIGVPEPGFYKEMVNSDSALFGGSNTGNLGGVSSETVPAHGFEQSVRLFVPPLGCLFLKLKA